MSSNYSGRTTPHSDVDHPHRITYSPFNEDKEPQPVPMLPPRPPTPGPVALENRGTQTSPKPCPIHQQHVAVITTHTPPFARQIQQPPTLQEALELRELLRNPDLQIPITTHCELHSLMFTLHRAYRNLIADKNHHPNKKQRKTLEANIIESLHQIDALPFLQDLKQIPKRHRRRTFCTNCYQLGHWKKDCRFYQCPIATYTNPTTRNTYASSNHSGLTADPRHLSNKNPPHHHPSQFVSPTREDSKTENQHPPLPRPPPRRLPMEGSRRTKGRGRRRTIIPANKGRLRRRSTKPSTK